jgi:hypothetical protein
MTRLREDKCQPVASPPPWTAEEIAGGYVVRDANKQALAYVYCHEPEHAASIAKVLSKDEARRIASNIAKLPRLIKAELACLQRLRLAAGRRPP